ncbi:hypothetical protein [Candidatus Halocynthiibacter alkanivorans]|uniref:hypothetical protein n=1 Tax=Candidatus Halocynthiibacter alkanivorans TaxID=2267619 RepID=UPI000DF1219F|nr:hypothetical protein [Candidatus Halocynthiibacter alkanivorans]
MRFGTTAFLSSDISKNIRIVRKLVTDYLEERIHNNALGELDAKLIYGPALPKNEESKLFVDEEFRVSKKDNTYICGPFLSHDVFAGKNLTKMIETYLEGMRGSVEKMRPLGATDAQVAEFEAILDTAADEIMSQVRERRRLARL